MKNGEISTLSLLLQKLVTGTRTAGGLGVRHRIGGKAGAYIDRSQEGRRTECRDNGFSGADGVTSEPKS